MEQKIIIRNKNLLFQLSDHNNNLLVLKLWKSTRLVIILIRSRGFAISYISFHVACSSANFDVRFVVSLKILVWYIHPDNCILNLITT